MKVEVILSTMKRESLDFLKEKNIETDCLVINQAGRNSYEEREVDSHRRRMISTDTIGVGRSRNIGLNNSKADIVIIADDDEVFEKGYGRMVEEEFSKNPSVDFFVFKTIIYQDGQEIVKVVKEQDLSRYNSHRYGAVHFAFRREDLAKANIFFSTCFGGGTENGSGEDTLFIKDAIKRGLKVRTSEKLLARVYNESSSRFEGYNERFFYNKGKLAKALYPRAYRIYIRQFLLRHKEFLTDVGKKRAKERMLEGAKEFGGRK